MEWSKSGHGAGIGALVRVIQDSPERFYGVFLPWDTVTDKDTAHRQDTFISKTTRLYRDSRTVTEAAGPSAPPSQLDQLNDNLKDVTRIMTKNMEDLLWRGDSLDRESSVSAFCSNDSKLGSIVRPDRQANANKRHVHPLHLSPIRISQIP